MLAYQTQSHEVPKKTPGVNLDNIFGDTITYTTDLKGGLILGNM